MKILARPFDGVAVIELENYQDERGFFLECYQKIRYHGLGICDEFVQCNHSRSQKNVLRGMHFTKNLPQSQLLTVMQGKIYDVVVDIRKDSPTFSKWFGVELGGDGPQQIYMSHGFAHGFCVLSDDADLHYMVSEYYDCSDDAGLRWDDPIIGIEWPVKKPIISKKDRMHPNLSAWL